MSSSVIDVIFAGVGGQGSILVSHLLADAALACGMDVKLTETYGAAMRGGSVFSCVRLGEAWSPLPGENRVEIVVGLEPLEGLRVGLKFLAPQGWVLLNTEPWYPVDASVGRATYPEIDQITAALQKLDANVVTINATSLAKDMGNLRMMNIVLLGGLMALDLLKIPEQSLFDQMNLRWNKKIFQINQQAYRSGYEYLHKYLLDNN